MRQPVVDRAGAATRSGAEHARALLADARTGRLRTAAGLTHEVTLEPGADRDLPLLWVGEASGAAAELASCRVATLVVDDPASPCRVRLTLSLRMRRPDATGRRAYEPIVLAVRLLGPGPGAGSGPVTVPVADFLRVPPDPARLERRRRWAHLETSHALDLVATARRLAPDVEDVVLLGLRGDGVEAALLGPAGVDRVTLAVAPCRCAAEAAEAA